MKYYGSKDAIKKKEENNLTSVGPPEFLHSMPHQHDAWKFGERLDDVEVAQRTDLEEGHAVLFRISSCLFRRHLSLEGEMQPVAHQDPGNAWGVLSETTDIAASFTMSES